MEKIRLQLLGEIAALGRQTEEEEKQLLRTATDLKMKTFWEDSVKISKEREERLRSQLAMFQSGVKDIANIDDVVWHNVLDIADVKVQTTCANEIPSSKPKAAPSFGWDDGDVHAQPERCIAHLSKIIDLPVGNGVLEWVDAAKQYPNLLSYDSSQTLGYDFRGTADFLLTEKGACICFKPMLGMRLLLDISKEVTYRKLIQAQAKLLLANLHVPERRPVMVLTDLCEEWYIMWLDGATMYQHPFASRDQAVGFIEELLAGRFDTSEGVQPSAFAARRELEPRLNVKHVRYVAHAEEMENFEGALDHEEVENMRHAHIIREALHPPSEPSWGKTSS